MLRKLLIDLACWNLKRKESSNKKRINFLNGKQWPIFFFILREVFRGIYHELNGRILTCTGKFHKVCRLDA